MTAIANFLILPLSVCSLAMSSFTRIVTWLGDTGLHTTEVHRARLYNRRFTVTYYTPPKVMIYFRALFLLFALVGQSLLAFAFSNPIKAKDGSDPFMVYHEGYYCASLLLLRTKHECLL